jgi:hypothetical protein
VGSNPTLSATCHRGSKLFVQIFRHASSMLGKKIDQFMSHVIYFCDLLLGLVTFRKSRLQRYFYEPKWSTLFTAMKAM